MNINSVKLVPFSPTGTTRTILNSIAQGLGFQHTEVIDITNADTRMQPLKTADDELLVVGVPVYMGRVPALLKSWLGSIEAKNTPTVCVVVYGNREFDDALLELKNSVAMQGCAVIAAGAYIGEHSFSDSALPTAQGRPDQNDCLHAENFGRRILQKLQAASDISQFSPLEVPGSYPYGGSTTLWDVDFIEVNEDCSQCGACAEICPVEAIDPQDCRKIDKVKCITCCACIKNCPQQARSIKPGPVHDAQKRLNVNCSTPKSPEYFL